MTYIPDAAAEINRLNTALRTILELAQDVADGLMDADDAIEDVHDAASDALRV